MPYVAMPLRLGEPVNLELNLSQPLFLQEPCPNQFIFSPRAICISLPCECMNEICKTRVRTILKLMIIFTLHAEILRRYIRLGVWSRLTFVFPCWPSTQRCVAFWSVARASASPPRLSACSRRPSLGWSVPPNHQVTEQRRDDASW